MDLINAVIIYFAFGVPFGILSVYLRSSHLETLDIFRVIYHLAFWPAFLIVRSAGTVNSFFRPQVEPRDIRFAKDDFESAAGRRLRRRIRSEQDILTGLITAHCNAGAATELSLPFEACIDHPNPKLAAKCFHRRNIEKLERYLSEAENDLSKSLEELRRVELANEQRQEKVHVEHSAGDIC